MIQFPFFTMQQLNLDWILDKLKTVLNFLPVDTGDVGDVLQRNADGAAWLPLGAATLDITGMSSVSPLDALDEVPVYDVSALENKKTTVGDIVAMASSAVTSVNGHTGAVMLDKNDVGLGNVSNIAQYSASNPPPYPVTSVNGQTGDVIITATSPVISVNSKIGAVVLDASDVGALPDSYTAPVSSVNGRTGTVTVADNRSDQNVPFLTWGHWTSSGVSTSAASLSLHASNNGKYVSICGVWKFTTGTADEWKYLYLYKNNSLDVIDGYVVPETSVEKYGVGFVVDENGDIYTGTMPIAVNFHITSTGNIFLSYYQPAGVSSGLQYKIVIPNAEICTAI